MAFINGLLNVIVSEGLVNETFIKARTEGYPDFVNSVAEYTPEVVSKITGVSEEVIREIARSYAGAKNASIIYSMGITQHTSGTKNVAALTNLALMTGQIGRPSTGINPLRGQSNVQGACDMGALPDTFPGYQKLNNPGVLEKFKRFWGRWFYTGKGHDIR